MMKLNEHRYATILLAGIAIIGITGALIARKENAKANDAWDRYTTEQKNVASPAVLNNEEAEEETTREKESRASAQSKNDSATSQEHDHDQALLIISGAGAEFAQNVDVELGETAFDLLVKLEHEGKLTMEAKQTNLGAFIEELNGVRNNEREGEYWFLYRNGQSANVGASALVIAPNETIEWRYERAQ